MKCIKSTCSSFIRLLLLLSFAVVSCCLDKQGHRDQGEQGSQAEIPSFQGEYRAGDGDPRFMTINESPSSATSPGFPKDIELEVLKRCFGRA